MTQPSASTARSRGPRDTGGSAGRAPAPCEHSRDASRDRYAAVVAALMEVRPDEATAHFDAEIARAVAEGRLDATTEGSEATITTIAVHPDHQRDGIGGALLNEVRALLPEQLKTLDAWTALRQSSALRSAAFTFAASTYSLWFDARPKTPDQCLWMRLP